MGRKNMENIREYLSTIVTSENTDNWCNPELFKKNILPIFPKEIEIIEFPPKGDKENYNCVTHVFGLLNETMLAKRPWGDIDPKFVRFLVDARELKERKNTEYLSGDIVVYRNDGGDVTHVGLLLDNGMVISKWSGGPLLKHKVLDVPQTYGDDIHFYVPPSKERIVELYRKWQNNE